MFTDVHIPFCAVNDAGGQKFELEALFSLGIDFLGVRKIISALEFSISSCSLLNRFIMCLPL